ncbi:gamma-gliadin [Strongylocentrotus purpuratus]|uniref:Microtubule-associated protein Jupiter n=1 Tax=Strongylocentrotus purpuratus TaxID=7668 RepID=A0A7M7HNF4_STRPU|nr:gamma-gliadin [Strongylocentrotus purpuratus]XP_011684193.1 gamma-gliadin [Strongylocentrotus purpuratus]XP_801891.1 gamma-gliadin [Strongylocentrotus purpuratus]|eukprot:XP_011684190.1 PREDICTED: gamma-gliadin [Strongylocentrotus purpuratus]
MTTTIIFSGKEGKNSSKVLAPPGGKSNNIFGFAEETPAPAQAQRRAPSQSPFAQDAAPKPQDSGPAKPFRPNTTYNPLTHSHAQRDQPPQQQAPQQQRAPPQQQQQQMAAPQQQTPPPQQQPLRASTLPQEPIGNNTDAKTSVKIYNPPGGKSSIQF